MNHNLSMSAGMVVFAAIMLPVLVIVTLCSNEFRKENSKTWSAAKPLIFSYAKKEMAEVDLFIAEIKESKKNYFLKIYYKVDHLIPVHIQMSRIHWLYENTYITGSDAKFIIKQLESKRIIEGL